MGEPATKRGDSAIPPTKKRYPRNVTEASLKALVPHQRKKGDPPLPGGGRPKGSFAERVRAATEDGQTLIDTMLKISKGGKDIRPIDQVAATEWLADRGYGKAQQIIKLEVEDPLAVINFNILSNEQLESVRSALRLVAGPGAPALEQGGQGSSGTQPA